MSERVLSTQEFPDGATLTLYGVELAEGLERVTHGILVRHGDVVYDSREADTVLVVRGADDGLGWSLRPRTDYERESRTVIWNIA